MRVSVISNGRLLAKKAGALADAGCSEVVLSLDALGDHHNRIRNTPRLFEHCLEGMAAIQEAGLSYGINTVLQAESIDDLPLLANLLFTRPQPPRWWHLIPVRGNRALLPDEGQIDRMKQLLPALHEQGAARGVLLVADADMFSEKGSVCCSVPQFTAYVRADTGNVYGCNMLVYAQNPLSNILATSASEAWESQAFQQLRLHCLEGNNSVCSRCDAGSRAMNHVLRSLAIHSPPSE
ncbi:hypothetical protein KTAU_25660 [Thermogemmatispora aurantia]|uniref:Uncharacterized protein n=2 Tax=Thermogemmatispora aurantia TaxID=2045279 RepID=A0A5J4KB05_9CHLR|nr:hypothetical protein KTAU_25660 [Thermogemmatispora aurantia]